MIWLILQFVFHWYLYYFLRWDRRRTQHINHAVEITHCRNSETKISSYVVLNGYRIKILDVRFLLEILSFFVEILTQIDSTREKSVTVLSIRPPDLTCFFVEFRLSLRRFQSHECTSRTLS